MVVKGDFGPFHRRLPRGLFCCADLDLKRLVISSRSNYYNTFIFPHAIERHELNKEFEDCAIDIEEDKVARGFFTVNALHACKIFLSWSSTAYHGLLDLWLQSAAFWSGINGAQILSNLQSSPVLRILHFGLNILKTSSDGVHIIPVNLQDLQVVKVFAYSNHEVRSSNVLRLLAPGPKPLWLCLEGEFKLDSAWSMELDNFFSQSNVMNSYAKQSMPPLSLFLRHSAHLECDMLDKFDSQTHYKLLVEQIQGDGPNSLARCNAIHLLNSALSKHSLCIFLMAYPLGIVLDSSSSVHHGTGNKSQRTVLSKEELSDVFPEVKTLHGSAKDPTVDWDLLD
ncbi:hypothetical protein B0J17DRAFT_722147 [Rhizoctonia solani]|nr:hypothetical protein B0J17DRAFT_722147 [Rhizoctonia solani]